ncbi:MAG: hypothetical protein ACFB0G_02685 [Leptolyngbyaceae cyanobacterium]
MKSQSLGWQPIALAFVALAVFVIASSSFVIINPGQAGVLSNLG